MVPYFRNKSREATSLYARYTLIDLVMELSSSERTRARMNHLVCVNPSGSRGGFMFRDKYNEVMVRLFKDAIRKGVEYCENVYFGLGQHNQIVRNV